VGVRVAVDGNGVFEAVGDGGTAVAVGTRTTIWAVGPALPPTSRTRAVRMVSPPGKPMLGCTRAQYWWVVCEGMRKLSLPEPSFVHAPPEVSIAVKRAPRACSAVVTS
jgi:hypothetical protein